MCFKFLPFCDQIFLDPPISVFLIQQSKLNSGEFFFISFWKYFSPFCDVHLGQSELILKAIWDFLSIFNFTDILKIDLSDLRFWGKLFSENNWMWQHLPLSLRSEHKTKNSSFESHFFPCKRSTFEKPVEKKEEKAVELKDKKLRRNTAFKNGNVIHRIRIILFNNCNNNIVISCLVLFQTFFLQGDLWG